MGEAGRKDGPILGFTDGADTTAHVGEEHGLAPSLPGRIDRPQVIRAAVAEQVSAVERRVRRMTDDDAADDRTTLVVTIFGHGRREASLVAAMGRAVAMEALCPVPPEVEPADTGPRDIDLLPRTLADVADPQIARRPDEAEAPRIAQAVEPDLGPGTGRSDERVVRRDGIWRSARRPDVDIDPQDLAEKRVEPLAVAVRIAA